LQAFPSLHNMLFADVMAAMADVLQATAESPMDIENTDKTEAEKKDQKRKKALNVVASTKAKAFEVLGNCWGDSYELQLQHGQAYYTLMLDNLGGNPQTVQLAVLNALCRFLQTLLPASPPAQDALLTPRMIIDTLKACRSTVDSKFATLRVATAQVVLAVIKRTKETGTIGEYQEELTRFAASLAEHDSYELTPVLRQIREQLAQPAPPNTVL